VLLVDSIKPVFTAVAAATGGRNGHTEASDHSVSVDLSVPKEMGGGGNAGTTTPEHLFAAGYAACFGGAHSHATRGNVAVDLSVEGAP
jgi:organic hydroperoxide reductase OsmC/OhrA